MRILVFGAGAVGSVLGGMLAHAGHRVTLFGRALHLQALHERGLCIEGIWGSYHVRNLETATSLGEIAREPFELVLLTVKAYDTAAAVATLQAREPVPETLVSVQNGYGNTEMLERAFGPGRALGARIITGVELVEPGRVRVTVTADDIRLGPPRAELSQMDQAERIARVLREAGIPVTATAQFREFLWAKILYNCALNPLGALLHATYGQLVDDSGTRALVDRIMDESFAVTQAAGIPQFWDRAEQYKRHFYEELIPPTATHYPSMLRDLERRGRTEIDALNGSVVELGRAHQLDCPVNQALTAMIKLREQTRRIELGSSPIA